MAVIAATEPTTTTAPGWGLLARRDASLRLAAAAALWLAMLLPTYWWIVGGGVADIHTVADGFDSVGRLTGLWASVLLLAQVILMARIPLLERAFGQDRLAHRHRLTGFTSFNLMLAHIVLITIGYADARVSELVPTAWDLSVNYPGMLLAVAGTACLVMVVVTSVKAARRRLRYESWHLMHLYAYLGVGLALPHQLWTGTDFLGSTSRTVFWWTLWAAAAAAVLIWRIALPLGRSLRHSLRVVAVVPEAPGVVSVWMQGRAIEHLDIRAGQFLTWRFLGRRGWTRANPYSVSAVPQRDHVRITVQEVGDGSRALAHLRPGSRVLIEGPFGRLGERSQTRPKVAFIGAGLGLAPLRALAEGLPYEDAVLLHRYRDQPLFTTELTTLAGLRPLRLAWLPGHRRSDDSWLADHDAPDDTRALLGYVPDLTQRDLFVCGPPAWVARLRAAALAAGLPSDQFHVETFEW
ncbi:ferric reductase-like transmembrane domain-containing protein [Nocardioides sp. Kera G14]|uniref:ferredoxin reductase family protein n=1 Tax=Nocardioides sp. Kera G14 TaxID=2884264 RepID=UPI001D1295C0|nr:ferredoxin reductase family protein [Nocardioides sp. Kera G14]UDY23434.1 ferric reductase-like transmembrane domain-containing protein [Nocardioides sp. Kera G14]